MPVTTFGLITVMTVSGFGFFTVVTMLVLLLFLFLVTMAGLCADVQADQKQGGKDEDGFNCFHEVPPKITPGSAVTDRGCSLCRKEFTGRFRHLIPVLG